MDPWACMLDTPPDPMDTHGYSGYPWIRGSFYLLDSPLDPKLVSLKPQCPIVHSTTQGRRGTANTTVWLHRYSPVAYTATASEGLQVCRAIRPPCACGPGLSDPGVLELTIGCGSWISDPILIWILSRWTWGWSGPGTARSARSGATPRAPSRPAPAARCCCTGWQSGARRRRACWGCSCS